MLCCNSVQRRCSVRVRGFTVLSMKQCLFLHVVLRQCPEMVQCQSLGLYCFVNEAMLVSSCCVVTVSRDSVVSELGGVLFCQ